MEFSHVLGKQMNWNGMITFRGIVVPSRQLRSRPRAIIFLMRVVISAALLGVTPRTKGFFVAWCWEREWRSFNGDRVWCGAWNEILSRFHPTRLLTPPSIKTELRPNYHNSWCTLSTYWVLKWSSRQERKEESTFCSICSRKLRPWGNTHPINSAAKVLC